MKRLCLFLALGAAATVALAQPRDRDERGRPRETARVIVYQEAGFHGDARVIFPGETIENMSGLTFENGSRLNDRISSIRIEGDAEVYVYENAGYRGEALRLTESVRDLSGRLVPGGVAVSWNDRISSLRVEGGRNRRPPVDRDRDRDRGRADFDLVIKRAFADVLLRDATEADLRQYRSHMIDEGWTEIMVRERLRDSEEFRRETVDRIVRRAYVDVLGREADPGGLRAYGRNMREKGWTEGDVRDDLRRSQEYRQKHGGH